MKFEKIRDVILDSFSGEWGEDGTAEDGIKVIRTANFTNEGVVDLSKVVYRKIDPKKVERKKLVEGDIIIEKSGGSPTQPVGRVIYFDERGEDYLCNNFTSVLRPNKKILFPKYFLYALFFKHQKGETLRYQNKTTGIINLKLDKYLDSLIVLPSLSDQIRIAEILSKAESLIAQRKESIGLLDELLKSTFLEMFGDAVKNKFKEYSLNDLKDGGNSSFSNGPFGSDLLTSELQEEGVPVIYIRDIRNGYFKWKSNVYVTEQKARSLANCQVLPDDIIIAKVGDPPGISAIYPRGLPMGIITQDVIRLRVNKNIVLPIYLSFFINSEKGKALIKKISVEGTRNRFPLRDFKNSRINIPSIELQTKFTQLVEKVDSLKNHYQQSLLELQNMYGILSQKAFKGELEMERIKM